ncbi:hypothetical protein VTO42DRAFT_1561 [Malbranchea cinnamomea]
MFFAPTLLALTRPDLGNHVKILCLSTGDADGLGHIRKKELQKSAVRLGVRNESDVFVVDDPSRFPDSITTTWSAASISSLLSSTFAPELALSSRSTTNSTTAATRRINGSTTDDSAPKATIDVLITFDKSGVSNHPNHRSLYHGARTFLQSLMKGKAGYACPVSLYTLTSTNIVRKYAGIFDAPTTMLYGGIAGIVDRRTSDKQGDPNRLLYVSGVGEWLSAWKAMVYGHRSQMVWFRWGWITIGRYMVVNDLKRERI